MAFQVMVRMLLSFVAHASGYKIMVGAYNTVDATVECQDRCRVLLHVGYGLWYSGFDL